MSKQKTIVASQESDSKAVIIQKFLQPIVLEPEHILADEAEFPVLDVGCGTKPKGSVNVDFIRSGRNAQIGDQIKGEKMEPKSIPNFVVADASHLPFRDDAFNMVVSSHSIEHVVNPAKFLSESCRVAKRKTVIRCPHKRGSGAKMPYHRHYFDEKWFRQAAKSLKLTHSECITSYDYPISNILGKRLFPESFKKNILYRILRHIERRYLLQKTRIPFEIECQFKKQHKTMRIDPIKFVVVYNNTKTLNQCFLSSININAHNVILRENFQNKPLPEFFNKIVAKYKNERTWLVFCHQDFVLQEDLAEKIKTFDINTVYGPIGTRMGENQFYGQILQTNGKPQGIPLKGESLVQTLDEMCLIIHTDLFRSNMCFDESFSFHFYGADLCMQAFNNGFDVKAVQLACQHRSRTITGDVASADYAKSLAHFKAKWQRYLPIRTTTKTVC